MINVGIECESIEGEAWGVGRIIEKLLQEIDSRQELKKEFKFFLYFKSKIPDRQYLKNPIFEKRVIRVSFLPTSFSLYYFILLPIKLWFEKLDAMYFPNYMLPIIFSGRSIVTLTPDVYCESHHGSLPFRYKLAYLIFSGWAARHATKIISVSQAAAKDVSEFYKIENNRLRIVPNGVDSQTNIEQAATIQDIKSPFGVVIEYLLCVGQAFPRRHLRETILAFEKIYSKFKNLKLVVIGKDKYNPPIINDLISKVNRKAGSEIIIHKDYVSQNELYKFYSHAKSVIYISSKEAFGLPPLEGLACGSVPVVADDSVTREIFGESAFFVKNPDSVEEISEKLAESMTNMDKREKIKNNAQEILSRYTWQNHTDKFLDVVKEITA